MSRTLKLSYRVVLLVLLPTALLIISAIQYPLSTTFPAGGDAAVHVRIARNVATLTPAGLTSLKGSWYPTSYFMFAAMKLVPGIDWPMRFVWFMALGQITTGITLGILLYRLSGPKSAAIAIGIWALTPIIVTPFFEDATMAQLWSLPWLILFFERYVAGSIRGMALMLLLTVTTHPVSALLLLFTLGIAAPQIWLIRYTLQPPYQKLIRTFLLLSGITAIAVGIILVTRNEILLLEFNPGGSPYWNEIITGEFLIWLLLSIPGAYWLTQRYQSRPDVVLLLGTFMLISLLLGLNDALGVGIWVKRLTPYIVLLITIGAAFGLPRLLSKTFSNRPLQFVFMGTLLVSLMASTWSYNANIYRRFESPSLPLRLHDKEREAIEWMDQNLSYSTRMFSTLASRHYEWIPALSNVSLISLRLADPTPNDYIVYFTEEEDIPDEMQNNTDKYPISFRNDAAVILGPIQ